LLSLILPLPLAANRNPVPNGGGVGADGGGVGDGVGLEVDGDLVGDGVGLEVGGATVVVVVGGGGGGGDGGESAHVTVSAYSPASVFQPSTRMTYVPGSRMVRMVEARCREHEESSSL